MNKKNVRLTVLLCTLLWTGASLAQSFKFVALGDMPYNPPADFIRFERLIGEINRLNPRFSIFIGDTKSGSTPCTDEYNVVIKNYFNQFKAPLIYSVGDNEWTDCHRPLAGSYDPLERLQNIRKTFFPSRMSLGKTPLQLTRQADVDPQYSQYVENSFWVVNNYLFVNLHIPGSNNNFEGDDDAIQEYSKRNRANLSWIERAFTLASNKSYAGIIFSYQADMFYKSSQATDADSGYKDTLTALSKQAQEFRKAVLLIHGDSHRLIIDQPLRTVDQKSILENVLRVQVMGAEQVQAIEIEVNPTAPQPFSFTPILMRENMYIPRN